MSYAYDEYNPIRSVDGSYIKCPSSFVWDTYDVSGDAAGRSEENAEMDKDTIAVKRKIKLGWDYPTIQEAADILTLFHAHEYLSIVYLDAESGTFETRTFYIGDRDAPSYNVHRGLWQSVSFNIIEK